MPSDRQDRVRRKLQAWREKSSHLTLSPSTQKVVQTVLVDEQSRNGAVGRKTLLTFSSSEFKKENFLNTLPKAVPVMPAALNDSDSQSIQKFLDDHLSLPECDFLSQVRVPEPFKIHDIVEENCLGTLSKATPVMPAALNDSQSQSIQKLLDDYLSLPEFDFLPQLHVAEPFIIQGTVEENDVNILARAVPIAPPALNDNENQTILRLLDGHSSVPEVVSTPRIEIPEPLAIQDLVEASGNSSSNVEQANEGVENSDILGIDAEGMPVISMTVSMVQYSLI
ncbi:hypothetical protein QAD02_018145 [Eretmocerus hayati]|uniref:Uncharacterized protein n=3 Tax=Eretmocerus hayati TaxID=131215 RepID=A0ACC2PFU5_9HYME|nr:hypothetical protein QAD02_016476 [Eretmocerus hayati]KAJ8682352.1 hypothetical protein QAD02_018144 [Eretmocerus hayati]KAJ8682353.1 hypothetical protein QAD02_018145 [Eretmocerus hayati]